MNRFSKILAIVLLLALLASVLGIFSVFAEDTASNKVEYGTFIKAPTSAFGSVEGASGGQPSITTNKDLNGKSYYTLGFNGVDPAAGDYVNIAFSSSGDNSIRVGDRKDADGNVMEGYDKNTDYMVVDFDMSTDTSYIDGLYFHTAFYNATYTHKARFQPKSMYFDLDGGDNENFSIGLNGNESATYAFAPYAEDVWQHVTFVYDFSDMTNIVVYFYINGIYSGSRKITDASSALTFYFFRISTPNQTINNASTNFANFSVKRFDKGYDGPFTQEFGLGYTATTLDQLPDLAYCMEDAPETKATKIADVERADGTAFTAYNVGDLDANLVDGDEVTLYRGIKRSLVVPTGANITFKDANGTVITPGTYVDGDLVNMSALAPTDYSLGNILKRSRKTYAVISQGSDLGTVISGSGNYLYTLLSDTSATFEKEGNADYYTVVDLNGYTATLTGVKGKSALGSGVKFTFRDGNLIWNGGGSDFNLTNASSSIIFDDVNLTHNAGTFVDGRGGLTMFNDSYVTRNPYSSGSKKYALGTLVSQKSRTGIAMSVIVDGTEIDFTNTTVPSGNTLENDYMFLMNNISTGGSRYAGAHNTLTVRDGSELKIRGEAIISAYGYASSEGTPTFKQVAIEQADGSFKYQNQLDTFTPSAAGAQNVNKNYINIIDSVIDSDQPIVSTEVSFSASRTTGDKAVTVDGVTTTYKSTTYTVNATAFDYDVDVNIAGSVINTGSSYVVYVARPATIPAAVKDNYDYDVNVSIDGNTEIVKAASIVFRASNRAVDMVIDIADGLKSNTANIIGATDNGAQATINLGAGESALANTSIVEGYEFIVTPEYRECSYAVTSPNGASTYLKETFAWNGTEETDPINLDKIVSLPVATDMYSYTEWAQNGSDYTTKIVPNFTLAANLNALTDFDLNVYLTATDASKLTVTVNGNTVTDFQAITIDGVDYIKAEDQVIKGITPEMAETTYPVVVSFTGGFGEKAVLTADVSVAEHLIKALAGENEKGVAFAQSIINYVVAANAYDSKTVESLAPYATTVAAPAYTNAKWEALAGVSAKLNLGDSVRWVFTATAGKTYTITYAGKTINATADEKGEIVIGMRAVSLTGDITIACDGQSATVNLAGYHGALAGNAAAQAVVNALYNYSEAAQAYAAVK